MTRNISWTDNSTIVDIDYGMETSDFQKIINNKLDTNCCWRDCYFGLKLSNHQVYKTYVKERCTEGAVHCHISDSEVDILVNRNGQILLENDYLQLNEILTWNKLEQDNESWQVRGFKIDWDTDVPTDTLNKIFSLIKEKYIKEWEECSQEIYSTSFCSLDIDQSTRICDSIPFKLKLNTFVYPKMDIIYNSLINLSDVDTISL